MPISSDQMQKIELHLNKYLKFGKCPMCAGNQWTIESEIIVYPIFDTQYKMIVEGRVIPMVAVRCNQCHFTSNFDAMKLGII